MTEHSIKIKQFSPHVGVEVADVIVDVLVDHANVLLEKVIVVGREVFHVEVLKKMLVVRNGFEHAARSIVKAGDLCLSHEGFCKKRRARVRIPR